MNRRTLVPGMPARHGRIRYFLVLSVLAHLLLLQSPFRPAATWQVPAPELSVTTLGVRASTFSAQSKKSTLPEITTESPNTSRDDSDDHWRENAPSSLPSETTTNHLRSLLRAELNKHFVYPPVARRNGWEGQVEIEVRLDHEGRLNAVRNIHSSGYAILDQDALLTLQKIGTIPHARAWLRGYSYDTQLPVLYRLTKG